MKSLSVTLAFLATLALASKDDSYYPAGTGNPNVNEKMYWKDAENVLQDLSQFSGLYVEFHKCAWTWMQVEDDGNDVDENDYWYMGKIPPMGANVAFSLYGHLKGSSFSGCDKSTFINSFYTNQGFTDFETAMQYAGVSSFQSQDQSYSAQCAGGYGVGCDTTNGFSMHKYSTSTCDPDTVSGIIDEMYYLNTAMKASSCIQIYDSSSSSYYGNNDDGDGDGDDDKYRYSGTALGLLSTSHACFYQNTWSPDGECPDPYGKIKYYQSNFAKGIQDSKARMPLETYKKKIKYQGKIKKGKGMTVLGAMLVLAACVIMTTDKLISSMLGSRKAPVPTWKSERSLGPAKMSGSQSREARQIDGYVPHDT